MMASYNTGLGHLLEAQRIADMTRLYVPIIAELPRVTDEHARETRTYVERIWRYYTRMLTGP